MQSAETTRSIIADLLPLEIIGPGAVVILIGAILITRRMNKKK